MLRTSDADAALDYDRTLVLAIELSNKSWVLAAQSLAEKELSYLKQL